MKKTFFLLAILFATFTVTLNSCSKDKDDDPITLEADYLLKMDGSTVASGTTDEVGMVGNAISFSLGEDFGVLITGVPTSTGGVATIGDATSACSVSITGVNLLENGSDELYFSISGTVTRSTGSKISFEGTCTDLTSSVVHTFSGTVESDVYKVI
ncbi:hypothetical protein [uncultured Draconibacterium sp.]|uniref:hypothetical protein n=1 Tax=uncultured Draconibacterium sp. TaxID=1573823 RepID=UPI0032163A95